MGNGAHKVPVKADVRKAIGKRPAKGHRASERADRLVALNLPGSSGAAPGRDGCRLGKNDWDQSRGAGRISARGSCHHVVRVRRAPGTALWASRPMSVKEPTSDTSHGCGVRTTASFTTNRVRFFPKLVAPVLHSGTG